MTEIIKGFIKEYGSAIGPILAFVFGILMMLIKYKFDEYVSKYKVKKSFKMLKKLIINSPPPEILLNDRPRYTIEQSSIDNLLNFTQFYNKLLSIKCVIDKIDKDIIESHDIKMISEYNYMKHWFNSMFNRVEEIINDKFFDIMKGFEIPSYYEKLKEIISSPEKLFKYIECKDIKNITNSKL